MGYSVVVVEDDKEIGDILIMYLKAADFDIKYFEDGVDVVEWVKEYSPAVILLDLDLPTKQGLDVCKEIRMFSEVPIIMTTAKVEEVNRLVGLEIGADDYVCKPYSIKELIARVKVQLRRLGKSATNDTGFKVDQDAFKVSYQNVEVELTAVEFKLFYLLYCNPNRIYSRGQIMDLVYQDYRHISDRTVDSHIRNLRKKLNKLNLENDVIRSIYGAGYKFELV